MKIGDCIRYKGKVWEVFTIFSDQEEGSAVIIPLEFTRQTFDYEIVDTRWLYGYKKLTKEEIIAEMI